MLSSAFRNAFGGSGSCLLAGPLRLPLQIKEQGSQPCGAHTQVCPSLPYWENSTKGLLGRAEKGCLSRSETSPCRSPKVPSSIQALMVSGTVSYIHAQILASASLRMQIRQGTSFLWQWVGMGWGRGACPQCNITVSSLTSPQGLPPPPWPWNLIPVSPPCPAASLLVAKGQIRGEGGGN